MKNLLFILPVSLLISDPAFSQVIPSEKDLVACHKEDRTAVRLVCYDRITKFKNDAKSASDSGSPKPKPAGVSGYRVLPEWVMRKERSKLDDSENVFLSVLDRKASQCKFKNAPHRLTLRCLENTTSVVITFGGCFMSGTQGKGRVNLRLDKDKSFVRSMSNSTDHQALGLWSGGKAIPFIKKMLDKEKLFVRATPFSDSPVEATYNIAGLAERIKPLRKACGW